MKSLLPYLMFILPLALASCEKDLDFKYKEIPPIPVIEGVMDDDGVKVGITLTTPMDEPMDLTRLPAESVTLTDLTDGSVLPLSLGPDGFYTSSASGSIGHRFRLVVELDGMRYSQETNRYPSVDILSSEFAWIKMPYDDVAVLQVLYTENPLKSDECFWVRVYRNDEIYMWNVQSDRTADDGVMTFFAMTSRRDTDAEDEDEVLLEGDKVTVTVSPISHEMHDYLEALANDSSGPLLFTHDRISPSNLNLQSFCLGYFMATSTVSTSLVFHPDDIPYAY